MITIFDNYGDTITIEKTNNMTGTTYILEANDNRDNILMEYDEKALKQFAMNILEMIEKEGK